MAVLMHYQALANVYGDLLDFCTNARSVFVGADGHPRSKSSFNNYCTLNTGAKERGTSIQESTLGNALLSAIFRQRISR